MRAVRYVILLATSNSCCFLYGVFYFKKHELALIDRIASTTTKQSPECVGLDLIFLIDTTMSTDIQILYVHFHFMTLKSPRAQM
jgi:hypothetical protein